MSVDPPVTVMSPASAPASEAILEPGSARMRPVTKIETLPPLPWFLLLAEIERSGSGASRPAHLKVSGHGHVDGTSVQDAVFGQDRAARLHLEIAADGDSDRARLGKRRRTRGVARDGPAALESQVPADGEDAVARPVRVERGTVQACEFLARPDRDVRRGEDVLAGHEEDTIRQSRREDPPPVLLEAGHDCSRLGQNPPAVNWTLVEVQGPFPLPSVSTVVVPPGRSR